jgi:hypothetical protein
MTEHERDLKLLAELPRGCRAEFEGLVDRYIQAELRLVTPSRLRAAAADYDVLGHAQPCNDGASALWFAAILRERAEALSR